MRNDGGPAFPSKDSQSDWLNDEPMWQQGMSMRAWFAGQALSECIRVAADQTPGDDRTLKELFDKAAQYAYYAADAMLQEHNKEKRHG